MGQGEGSMAPLLVVLQRGGRWVSLAVQLQGFWKCAKFNHGARLSRCRYQ